MTVVEQEHGGGVQNSSVGVIEHRNYASSVEMTAEGGKDDKRFTSELYGSEIMMSWEKRISAFDRLNDVTAGAASQNLAKLPELENTKPHDCQQSYMFYSPGLRVYMHM